MFKSFKFITKFFKMKLDLSNQALTGKRDKNAIIVNDKLKSKCKQFSILTTFFYDYELNFLRAALELFMPLTRILSRRELIKICDFSVFIAADCGNNIFREIYPHRFSQMSKEIGLEANGELLFV